MYSSWGLSKDQLAAIGALIVESSACEAAVERYIWEFARLNKDEGRLFTRSLQMIARLDLLSSLIVFRLTNPERVSKWNDIIIRFKDVVRDRNTFVHGVCEFEIPNMLAVLAAQPGTYRAQFANHGKGKVPRVIDADRAQHVIKALNDVQSEMLEFLVEHFLQIEKGLSPPA